MRVPCIVAGAVTLAAVATARTAAPQPTAVPRPVRAIIEARCAICHAPAGPSPMPLVTDEQILRWTEPIRQQILARRMPKWNAARGYGAFSNDPTLTTDEMAAIAGWADGEHERTYAEPGATQVLPKPAIHGTATIVPAGVRGWTVRPRSGWITGWDFTPGDPLITSATFTSADGSLVGTWVAGDAPVRLPGGSAMQVTSPIRIELTRREKTAYETAFTARASTLRFSRFTGPPAQPRQPPAQRVRIARVACGGTLGPSDASVIGVRPVLARGASAQVMLERIGGAAPVLLGWFRDFDPAYARIYWLERPIDFAANARLTSATPCGFDLVLSSRH